MAVSSIVVQKFYPQQLSTYQVKTIVCAKRASFSLVFVKNEHEPCKISDNGNPSLPYERPLVLHHPSFEGVRGRKVTQPAPSEVYHPPT